MVPIVLIRDSRGFSLVEVMVVVGIMSVLGLGVITMMSGVSRNITSVEARGAKLVVSDAIRMQLSSKNTCLNSFINFPTDWASTAALEVGINLNSNETTKATDETSLVAAGRELPAYSDLKIKSLRLTGLRKTLISPTSNFFAGTLDMSSASVQMGPNDAGEDSGRFALRPIRVANVVFEVPLAGGAPTGCFYANPELDVSNLTEMVCKSMGGVFTAGKCATTNTSGGKCATQGVGAHPLTNSYVLDGDLHCEEQTPELMYESKVPVGEQKDYIWYCPGNYPGFPTVSWDRAGSDPNHDFGYGRIKTGECQASRKLVPVPPTKNPDGSIVTSWPNNVTCYKPHLNPLNPNDPYATGPLNPECYDQVTCVPDGGVALVPTRSCVPPPPSNTDNSG